MSYDDLNREAALSDERLDYYIDTQYARVDMAYQVRDAQNAEAIRTTLACPEVEAMRDAARKFQGETNVGNYWDLRTAIANFDALVAEAEDGS